MGKPHPLELRGRVVAFVDEGHSHREAARHFRVSPKFVNDMIKLRRATGGLRPKRQGNPGCGKLTGLAGWVRARLAEKGDLTLDELRLELEQAHGVTVHRASVGAWLHRLRLSHKKKPCAPPSSSGRTSRGRATSGSAGGCRSCVRPWNGWSSLTKPRSTPSS
jgi:transposase